MHSSAAVVDAPPDKQNKSNHENPRKSIKKSGEKWVPPGHCDPVNWFESKKLFCDHNDLEVPIFLQIF